MSSMDEFEFASEPVFQIPKGCERCGVLCDHAQRVSALLFQKKLLEHSGTNLVSEDFDQMVEANLEMLQQTFPEKSLEEIILLLRQTTAEGLDAMDKLIEGTVEEMEGLARSCSGTLNMRATRNGIAYIVYVCTSARVHMLNNATPVHMPMHVRTESSIQPPV